jgi:hypothetical protein
MKKGMKIYNLLQEGFTRAMAAKPGRTRRGRLDRIAALTTPVLTATALENKKNSREISHKHHDFRHEREDLFVETRGIFLTPVRTEQKIHYIEYEEVEKFSEIGRCIFTTVEKMVTTLKNISETLDTSLETSSRFSESHKTISESHKIMYERDKNFSEGHGIVPTGRGSKAEIHEVLSEGPGTGAGGYRYLSEELKNFIETLEIRSEVHKKKIGGRQKFIGESKKFFGDR